MRTIQSFYQGNYNYCPTHYKQGTFIQVCFEEQGVNVLCKKCMQNYSSEQNPIPIKYFLNRFKYFSSIQSQKLQNAIKIRGLMDQFFQNLEKRGSKYYNFPFYDMLGNVIKQYRCLKRSFDEDTYQRTKSKLLFQVNFQIINDLVFSYNWLKKHSQQMKNPKNIIVRAQVQTKQIEKIYQKIKNKVKQIILQMRQQLKHLKLTNRQKSSLIICDQIDEYKNQGMFERFQKHKTAEEDIEEQNYQKLLCDGQVHFENLKAICLQEDCMLTKLICKYCEQEHFQHNKLCINEQELSVLKLLSINSKHQKYYHQYLTISHKFKDNIQKFKESLIKFFKKNTEILLKDLGFSALDKQMVRNKQISFRTMFRNFQIQDRQIINVQSIQRQIMKINQIIERKFSQIGQCLNENYSHLQKLTIFSQQITKLTPAYFRQQQFDQRMHPFFQYSRLRMNFSPPNSLLLHPFFEYLSLCPSDFDEKGNFQFLAQSSKIEMRGGFPYYQPILCKRYGLRVSQLYNDDNGDKSDQWLKMDGAKGQWAVAFHGVRQALNKNSNGIAILTSIMEGREAGTMLKAGPRQTYMYLNNVNKFFQRKMGESNLVGRGIYVSPHIQQCLFDATPSSLVVHNGKNLGGYHLVLQCRVKPSRIRIIQNKQQSWVIQQSNNIRPYGIILIKAQNIGKIMQRWHKIKNQVIFKYSFKQKIDSYRQEFNKLLTIRIQQRGGDENCQIY